MLMVILSIIVLGLLALEGLPLAFMPNFSSDDVDISVSYVSSSPEEVERLITRPIEEIMGTLPHLENLSSTSSAEGSRIEVEFVDAYERPIPGLTRADCTPIKTSGKGQQVKWKGDPHPDQAKGDYRGGVMARIYMKNTKLYSCTFAMPDPDGKVRRYWANYNWNRNIFHRHDQWDSDNNLPAAGLKPVTRGIPNYREY